MHKLGDSLLAFSSEFIGYLISSCTHQQYYSYIDNSMQNKFTFMDNLNVTYTREKLKE
jgi:hypothetical protein